VLKFLKALLKDWHLELSAGQYRPARDGATGTPGLGEDGGERPANTRERS